MKKNVLFILLISMCFYGCKKRNLTVEDIISDSFVEYSKENLSDYEKLEGILSVEATDTISLDSYENLYYNYVEIALALEVYIEEAADLGRKIKEADKFEIIEYTITANFSKGGREKVRYFYAYDDGYDIKIQDHKIKTSETPEIIQEIVLFCEKFIR